MNSSIARLSLVLLTIVPVSGLIHACGRDRARGIGSAQSEPEGSPPVQTAVADLVEGPLSMFDRACSRCHGPQGSFFGSSFSKLGDDQLQHQVEEMMTGPAQLQPSPIQVEAMVAYQRALRDRQPFLCVTNGAAFSSGNDTALKGEAVPGAAVTLRKGNAVLAASSEQFTWSVRNAPRPPFTVVAVHGETAIRLEYPAQLWSR